MLTIITIVIMITDVFGSVVTVIFDWAKNKIGIFRIQH